MRRYHNSNLKGVFSDMKMLTKLICTSSLLIFSTFCFSSDKSERIDHFKGIVPASVNEAQQILTDYNKKLAKLIKKEKLDMKDMGEIHMLTYTLENQLGYMMEDLKKVADELEKLHLLSESTEAKKAQAQAVIYLKNSKAYQK